MQFTYLLSIAVALVTVSALPANSSTTADSSTFTTAYNNIVLAHPGITPTDATSATWGFLDAVNVVNSTTTLNTRAIQKRCCKACTNCAEAVLSLGICCINISKVEQAAQLLGSIGALKN